MTIEELAKEVGELRRRLSIAETKLAQQAGQFEFITGQLRDVQLYMHARFDDVDKRFDKVEADIGELKSDMSVMKSDMKDVKDQLTALPRVLAEMITKR